MPGITPPSSNRHHPNADEIFVIGDNEIAAEQAPPEYSRFPNPKTDKLEGASNPSTRRSNRTSGAPTPPAPTLQTRGVRSSSDRRVPTFGDYMKQTSVTGARRCGATRQIDNVVKRFLSSPNSTEHEAKLLDAQNRLLPRVQNNSRRDLVRTQLVALIALAALAGTVTLAAGLAAQPQNRSGSGSGGGRSGSGWWFGSGSAGGSGGGGSSSASGS